MKLKWIMIGLSIFSISFMLIKQYIYAQKPKVAVIQIKGELKDPVPEIRKLQAVYEEDSIKSVVIRVDSPGGSVGTAQEIYRAIEKLKEKKPVVVSMGNIAASGGLYLSMPANVIYANPGTITGSIGVIIQHTNLSELLDKIGVEIENVKTGKYKDLLNFAQPLGEKKKILKQTIEEVYWQFIEAILKYRDIDKKTLLKIADGRVFTAQKALEYRLIDKIGNLQDAIDEAIKLSKSNSPEIIRIDINKSFLSQMLNTGMKILNGDFSLSYKMSLDEPKLLMENF